MELMKSVNTPETVTPDLVAYSRSEIWRIALCLFFSALMLLMAYDMLDPAWGLGKRGRLTTGTVILLRNMPPLLRSGLALAVGALSTVAVVNLIWLRLNPQILCIIDENGIELRASSTDSGRRVAWEDIGEIKQTKNTTRLIRSSAADQAVPRELLIEHETLNVPINEIHAVIRHYRPDLFVEKPRRPWWKF
jgi:hypothetical protein